ncbi:MAG TPA: hypothetical protein VJT75_10210 [Thermoleophilaceae bacterium]|nr:hypothetical protein [Thermoleophilaceae bacterium]
MDGLYGVPCRDVMVPCAGLGDIDPDVWQHALDVAAQVKARRPDLHSAPNDFEWGMWCGKHSALRWVLGDEWDNLDT